MTYTPVEKNIFKDEFNTLTNYTIIYITWYHKKLNICIIKPNKCYKMIKYKKHQIFN